MNWWLVVGAMLLLGAAVAHSLLGEKVVLQRLFRRAAEREGPNRRAGDDPLTRQTLSLAWHSLSVVLVGLAAILFEAARDGAAFGTAWRPVMMLLTATFVALAALSLVIARGRHVGWMWFLAVAAATWLSMG
ncbi:MAG: hypothetical protein WD771_09775 [Gemmatimonadaceae bacterium]